MMKSNYIIVNVLTLLRIIGIPFIFMIQDPILRVLFADFLFITDFLDGYLARKLNVSSALGAVLDLIADKMLVIYVLFIISLQQNNMFIWILFILIAAREIYSMILRYIHYKKSKSLINASMLGKTKTAVQFITLNFALLGLFGSENYYITEILLVVIVGLSYYSFLGYFKKSKENND